MGDRQTTTEVAVPVGKVTVAADLTVPEQPRGLVIFAHGTGSSRHSPRNQYVATMLQRADLATLLMDLLTDPEEAVDRSTRELRFDIGLLAERLRMATAWSGTQEGVADLPKAYFGASTGAAAALVAAAVQPGLIQTVVSRGGRPDLAGDALEKIDAPVLLIVGGADQVVLELNEEAARHISADVRIEVVPGATHLFEEPGALERVAALARDWFQQHLSGSTRKGDTR